MWWCVAAAGLVALFVVARCRLIASSYDSLANWEEPVFLYSGVDLGEKEASHLFDYQDDLSHGGSLPLVLMAVPWVRTVGWRLDTLKGIAVVWSAATLTALLFVGARFVSPCLGLLLGLLYAASPVDAALQVTLVGSHPEAVLFMTLALAAYLRALERDKPGTNALLGVCCGMAAWCSYLAAPWSAALGVAYVARRPRAAIAAACGAVAGMAPWILQNLVLRPHGAMQWITRTGASQAGGEASPSAVVRLAQSLTGDAVTGTAALALLLAFAAWAVLMAWRRRRHGLEATASGAAVLPAALALLVSVAMLELARMPQVPREGFYYFRFFAPSHLALFWLACAGVDDLATRYGGRVWGIATAVTFAFAVVAQLPLYRGANTYVPDAARDLAAGCVVFGHAEVDRAASDREAVARLGAIAGEGCRRSAFTGFGWRVVSRYAADGDVARLGAALDCVTELELHVAACRAARGLMANLYLQAMTRDRRETGALFLDSACASSA